MERHQGGGIAVEPAMPEPQMCGRRPFSGILFLTRAAEQPENHRIH
jgi:hypothetical protein